MNRLSDARAMELCRWRMVDYSHDGKPPLPPFFQKGHLYATNGVIVSRTPHEDAVKSPGGIYPDVSGLNWPTPEEARSLPEFSLPPVEFQAYPCSHCSSAGSRVCTMCMNIGTCICCRGAGKILWSRSVRIGDNPMRSEWVWLLRMMGAERVHIINHRKEGGLPAAYFRRDDGLEAMVVGLREDEPYFNDIHPSNREVGAEIVKRGDIDDWCKVEMRGEKR